MSTCCYERRSFAWAPTFFRSRSVGPPFHYRIIRPARPASQAKSPHRAVGGSSFTFVSAILGTGSIRAKPNAWFQAVGRHTQRTSLKPANARDRRRQLAFKEARGTAAKANRGKRQPVGKAAGQHPFGEIAGLRVFRANTGARKSAQVLTGQGSGDEGDRASPVSGSKTAISSERGTESGTVDAPNSPSDPDLAVIQDRWPSLPEHVKAAIMALVRSCVSTDRHWQ